MPTCGCLEGPTWADVENQRQAADSVADLWELRVDLLHADVLQHLRTVCNSLRDRPLLLTSRSKAHGGLASDHLHDQLEMQRRLASYQPEYLDVEWPVSHQHLSDLRALSPETKIIISWHGQDLPDALEGILKGRQALPVDLWKIAPFCSDAARWMKWQEWWDQHAHLHGRLLFQPQGPLGILQRLWGYRWQQPWVFLTATAGLEGRVSPGEWQDVYRMARPFTDGSGGLYGVVGDPVAQSRGRLFHNGWMEAVRWPGRYAPIRCSAGHWNALWPWLRKHAAGLAITTPLKQQVVESIDALDSLAAAASSVNTLVRLEAPGGSSRWLGVNTDGPAAVAVMGGVRALQGKKVLVLGAGGVGRAVALACRNAGASVTVLARRPEQAQVAMGSDLEVAPLECWAARAHEQDWVVQATTCGFYGEDCAVDTNQLSGQSVLEIVQKETPFLQTARVRGCRVVEGVEMFVHLSKLQAELWTGGAISFHSLWNRSAENKWVGRWM